MKKICFPPLRKGLVLFVALFLTLTQLAFAAELTPEELAAMPAVSVTYYTVQGGDPVVLDATPTLSPLGKSYWAMVPPEAFNFPITLTVTASDIAPYTFSPATGDTLTADASTVDFSGASTLITAYQNDVMVDTYWLFVSTAEMPLIVEPAEIPVYYVDNDDNTEILHYEVVSAYYDEVNIVTVNPSLVPANYTLVGNESATVTVDQTGAATPAWVTFYFQAQILQGTFDIHYTDRAGNPVASSQSRTYDPGTYYITPEPTDLQAGYVLTPDNPAQVEVTITNLGVPSTSAVTFVYDQEVVPGYLTVNYTSESGAPLAGPETLELAPGEHTVTPNPALIPQGYVLSATSQTQFQITVNTDGTLSPTSSVTFVYAEEAVVPVEGYLPVYYTDAAGNPLLPMETRTLAQGTHQITPNDGALPSGYALTSPAQVEVTINASGAATPASVTFIYDQSQAATPTPAPTEAPTEAPAATPAAGLPQDVYADYSAVEAAGTVNTTNVRLRSTPSTASTDTIVYNVDQGTSVWVYGTFTANDYLWAYIQYNNTDCYVVYSYVTLDAAPTEAPTEAPTATPAATPTDPTAYPDYAAVGETAVTNTSSVNIRSTPVAGVSDNFIAQVTQGTEVYLHGTFSIDGTVWAYIRYADTDSYVWYSLLTIVTPTEAPTETPTATPAPTPLDPTAYPDYAVIDTSGTTNATGVRLRSVPSTVSSDTILYQVPMGTAVWVYGSFTEGGALWAYVRYDNTDCYVMYDYVTLDAAEPTATDAPAATPTEEPTAEPTASPTQTPAATPASGEPEDISAAYPDYTPIGATGATNVSAVNIRSVPVSGNPDNVITQVPLGTEVWVHGSFTSGDTAWAYIRYNSTDCYVWLTLLDVDIPVATPTPAATATPTEEPAATPTEAPAATPTEEPAATPTEAPAATPTEAPTATPANMPGESDSPADISATYPGYTAIGKPGATNATGVRFRSTPDSSNDSNVVFQVSQGSAVWVHGSFSYGGRDWAYIRYATTDCYVWLSLLNVDGSFVTPSPSPSPSPSPTPEPTASPTPVPTDSPTPEPTAAPTTAPTASPAATPTSTTEQVDLYVGFGVTTTQVSLRDNANFEDNSIIVTLPADTLLYLNGQVNVDGTMWTGAQTRLGEKYIGLMPYASVRTITPGEAQVYIDAYDAAHAATPTPSPSPTPTPAQQSGYFLTLGDDVPLRTVPGSQASISAWISEDQAVYVSGQLYSDGYSWHVSNYNGLSGYIRADQLRAMTSQEVTDYLAQVTPTATPASTAAPYDPNALSSYGYVTANSVNFRSSPGGTRIGVLNRYAFGLVLGSQVSGGTTWYNINQSGKVGWISGDFFNVMNLTELSAFLNSSEYLQGIQNSGSTTTTTGTTTTGSATQGQVSAVEDWNVGVWENPSSSLNATYEPFNPYATPSAPVATEGPTPEPSPTFVIGTMIPIAYEEDTKETQSGSGWVGLVLGGIVLIGGAGGVYAYALTQNKKRKAAARAAAARRSQSANGQDNPYARRAAAAPPTAPGQQQNGQTPYQRPNPYARQQQPQQNPYAQRQPFAKPQEQAPRNPYARPQQQAPDTQRGGDNPQQHTSRRSDRYHHDGDDNA